MSGGLWPAPLAIGDWLVLVVDHRTDCCHERKYRNVDRRVAELHLLGFVDRATDNPTLADCLSAFERGDFTVVSDSVQTYASNFGT